MKHVFIGSLDTTGESVNVKTDVIHANLKDNTEYKT